MELRRGLLARLRPEGALELLSYAALGVVVLSAAQAGAWWSCDRRDTVALIALMLAIAIPIRIAVWREYVVADEDGIRYRSLFRTTTIPWRWVEGVRLARMYFPFEGVGDVAIELDLLGDVTRRMRASVHCSRRDRLVWIAGTTGLVARHGNSPGTVS